MGYQGELVTSHSTRQENRAAVRRVMLVLREHNIRVVCVTSPGEDAAHHRLATELARSFASSGARTLLLDLDSRRLAPDIAGTWAPGLGAGCITPAAGGGDNLFVAKGSPQPQLVDLFSFPQILRAALDKEFGDFGAIVCVTAPLRTSEFSIDPYSICAASGGTLLVCDALHDTTETMRIEVARLKSIGANLIGCVLSDCSKGLESSRTARLLRSFSPRLYALLQGAIEFNKLIDTSPDDT